VFWTPLSIGGSAYINQLQAATVPKVNVPATSNTAVLMTPIENSLLVKLAVMARRNTSDIALGHDASPNIVASAENVQIETRYNASQT